MTSKLHISFDLDGTLINSKALMEFAWSNTMRLLSLNCGFDKYWKLVGLPFPVILKSLNLDNNQLDIERNYFDISRKNLSMIDINPGAVELLKTLRDLKVSTSIITSKPRSSANDITLLLGLNTDILVCPEDVQQGKPNTHSMNLVRSKLNLDPKCNIFYVGDSIVDLQFSINSNIHFIHYAPSKADEFSLHLIGDYRTIKSLPKIAELITPMI